MFFYKNKNLVSLKPRNSIFSDPLEFRIFSGLISVFGSSKAIFLSHLHHCLQNKDCITYHGKRWVKENLNEISKKIFLSHRQTKRIIHELKSSDVILIEKLSPKKSDQTNFYTINYQVLEEIYSNHKRGGQ